jgi:hypothetical protein
MKIIDYKETEKSMEKKSPITDRPLHYPGESLDREITKLQDEMFSKYGVYAAFFFTIAIVEWLRFLTNAQPNPWVYSISALFVISFCTYKIMKIKGQVRLLELGRDGERAVGEYLDRLRENGYAVFHDIVGDGFNIDHVICSPSGIYAVETKTRSKPIRGEAKVIYDGKKVIVDGMEMERDPIIQAKAQAKWLREVLRKSTGKTYPIHPVILFPGWYVESKVAKSSSRAWVLNPKALPAFIESAEKKVPDPDLHLASYHLSRYIRSEPN